MSPKKAKKLTEKQRIELARFVEKMETMEPSEYCKFACCVGENVHIAWDFPRDGAS